MPYSAVLIPNMKNSSRLFYLITPLQSLIVAEIRKSIPGNDTIIYAPFSASERHRQYFDSIIDADKYFILHSPIGKSQIVNEFVEYLRIPRSVRRSVFDEYYISSIGSLPFGLLLRMAPGALLGTFDDGLFNISPDIFFNWIDNEGPARRRIKALLGVSDNRALYERSSVHYTIFAPERNVFPQGKLRTLDIFKFPASSGGRTVRVLLGTPSHLFSQGAAAEYARVKRLTRHDVFLPHPAEVGDVVVSEAIPEAGKILNVARTQISEVTIALLCKLGMLPEVYGVGSTTLLNVSKSLQATNIVIDGLNDTNVDIFNNFGIRCVASGSLQPE